MGDFSLVFLALLIAIHHVPSSCALTKKDKTALKVSPPRGYIQCDSTNIQYEILTSDIKNLMIESGYNITSTVDGVAVGDFHIYVTPECKATAYPRAPSGAHLPTTAFVITFPAADSGTTITTSANGMPEYRNTVFLSLRVPIGNGPAFHPRSLKVPFICVAEQQTYSSTELAVVDTADMTEPVAGSYEISLSMSSRSVFKPFAPFLSTTQVYEITARLQPDQAQNYTTSVERCWVTPEPPHDHPLSHIIIDKTCAVDQYTTFTADTETLIVFESLPLQFGDAPTKQNYIHCVFNMCWRALGSPCAKCSRHATSVKLDSTTPGKVTANYRRMSIFGRAPRTVRNGQSSTVYESSFDSSSVPPVSDTSTTTTMESSTPAVSSAAPLTDATTATGTVIPTSTTAATTTPDAANSRHSSAIVTVIFMMLVPFCLNVKL